MQTVGLFDSMAATPAETTSVEYDPPFDGPGDTVSRALELAAGLVTVPPMRVVVEKRIPSQAGLGGGSSDAAGALRIVDAVIGGALGEESARAIARHVGMDTPFFLTGGLARCSGYGETVEPRGDGEHRSLVVAVPSVGVSSGDAYARLDRVPLSLRPVPEGNFPWSNDFAAVAPQESLDLIGILRDLGATDACLSGSGSACFGSFPDERAAVAAAAQLQGKERAWAVKTVGAEESVWTSLS